ncbi:MAG: S49 family peptidase [Chlamydiae bacterium]|nr:S49 family peptidase [Chlamydiota bacterium]
MENSQESIFISSLRSFFKGFLSIFGSLLAIVLVIFIVVLFSSGQESKNDLKILPDLNGNDKILPSTAPVVLKMNIEGFIGKDILTSEHFLSQLLESRKNTLQNNRVKAILLNFNTGGGGSNTTDIIYRALIDYKKKFNTPIYAYVDGVCASGGMYIACAADKIYSNPTSIIGSIGELSGPFFNVNQLLAKWNIESKTFTEGLDKDMMNPFRPWTENEGSDLKKIGAFLYKRFIEVVVTNRKNMDKDKLINEYGAHVFDSVEAEKLGYIDQGNSNYDTALSDLLKAAKIDANKPYQVVELAPKSGVLSSLFKESSNFSVAKLFKTLLHIQDSQQCDMENFYYLYQPQNN